MEAGNPRLVVCAAIGAANGVAAMAAALAVSASRGRAGRAESGVALIDLRSSARPLRGAVLASSRARSIESLCREHPGLRPAARGRVCFLTAAGEPSGPERAELLSDLLSPELGVGLVVAVCDPPDFRGMIAARISPRRSVLLKATRGSDRPLIALLAAELRAEGIPVKVWVPAIGPVGARRALAGLDPGGETARRAARLASRVARDSRRRPAAGRGGAAAGGGRPGATGGPRDRDPDRRARPDPRRDRRGGNGQGAPATLRRSGRDLGGAIDAGRLRSPLPAGAAARRRSEPRPPGAGGVPRPGAGCGDGGGRAQRPRPRSRRGRLPGPAIVRSPAGPGGDRRGDQGRGRGRTARGPGSGHVGGREGRGDACCRDRRRATDDGRGRRLRRSARLPAGRADATGRRDRLRPHGGGRPRRRSGAGDQLRLSLRRRAAAALGREPRSALGRSAGYVAASLRDRARSRPLVGLWMARRERLPLRFHPALRLGGLALRVRRRSGTVLGRGRPRRRERRQGRRGRRPEGRDCPASCRRGTGPRCWRRRPATTSPRRCWRRS